MKKHYKLNGLTFVILLTSFLLVGIFIGYGIKSQNIDDCGGISCKEMSYELCNNFAMMEYLFGEYIKHYQNSSFEYSAYPNCEAIIDSKIKIGKLTEEEYFNKFNLTHLEWNKTK